MNRLIKVTVYAGAKTSHTFECHKYEMVTEDGFTYLNLVKWVEPGPETRTVVNLDAIIAFTAETINETKE